MGGPDAGADDQTRVVPASRETEITQLLENHVAARSPNLIEALAILEGFAQRPILILVDQFEELFRYTPDTYTAIKFVDVLLRTAAGKGNIYVAITIRTDELEKCSTYPGLAAAINKSQFLTPSLDRFQIEEAIEGPIAVFGGHVDRQLTLWLLNSIEDELDKLPLLQHVMKLLYRHKGGRLRAAYEDAGKPPSVTIKLEDFFSLFAFGSHLDPSDPRSRILLRKSLSNSLDAIYDGLRNTLQAGAMRAFCALTTADSQRRDIRRPLRLRALAATVGLSVEDTREIVLSFSTGSDAYLQIRANNSEPGDAIVDVTHECVLRLWDKLQVWLAAEQTNARNIRFLAELATTHDEGLRTSPVLSRLWGENLLTSEQLRRFGLWFDTTSPNATWADRYLKDFGLAQTSADVEGGKAEKTVFGKIEALLTASRRRQELKRRSMFAGAAAVAVIAVVATAYSQLRLLSLQQVNKRLVEQSDADIYEISPSDKADADCGNPESFCARYRRAKQRPKLSASDISKALAKPICPATDPRAQLAI